MDSEEWDDGNLVNGEGWSSSCTIEDSYVWAGGSETGKDTWRYCMQGFSRNEAKTDWIIINPSWTIKIFAIIFGITVTLGIILAIIWGFLMTNFYLSVYSVIEQT